MIQEILTYFKANPGWSLAITVFTTVLIWLYKEFKVLMEKDNNDKLALLQKQLDLYSSMEAAIAQVIHRPNDAFAVQNFYNKLGKSSSYFTNDIKKIVRDYYLRADTSILRTLMTFIQLECDKLHKEKSKLISSNTSSDVFETVFRLYKPFKPIVLVFVIVFVTIYFLLLSLNQNNILAVIILFIIFISLIISGSVIWGIISLAMEGDLGIYGKYRWSLTIFLIGSPFVMLLDLRLSILSLLIQIVLIVLLARSRENQLVRL
ncbi:MULTISPECIES: hypothetical protein [unclassified Paenibacillus]|uniref:hypothetical protein n=1 Tax=unclassified Paenibacillus TaxID=185978 RepID=UPI0036875743